MEIRPKPTFLEIRTLIDKWLDEVRELTNHAPSKEEWEAFLNEHGWHFDEYAEAMHKHMMSKEYEY